MPDSPRMMEATDRHARREVRKAIPLAVWLVLLPFFAKLLAAFLRSREMAQSELIHDQPVPPA